MIESTPAALNQLWAKVIQTPRHATEVDFTLRGIELKALVRVLIEDENAAALASASSRLRTIFQKNPVKKDEIELSSEPMHNKFFTAELISRAFYRVDEPDQRFFPNAHEIAHHLTLSEIELLFNKYLIVQAEQSPMKLFSSDTDLDEWLERLEEAGGLHPLGSLGWVCVTHLVTALIKRLSSLQSSKSLLGLPHDDSLVESKMEALSPSEAEHDPYSSTDLLG